MSTRAGASARRMARRYRRRAWVARGLALVSLCLAAVVAAGVVGGEPRAGRSGRAGVAAAATGAACALWAARARSRAARWHAGATGEIATAASLAPLERRGFVVRLDMTPRGWRGNVDAIVVGRTGVTVVETKRWSGAVVAGRRLRLDGRPRPEVIEQVERQVSAVSRALDDEVSVRGVLCVQGASVRRAWRFPGEPRVGAVRVVPGASLIRAVARRPTVLRSRTVRDVVAAIDENFAPNGSQPAIRR